MGIFDLGTDVSDDFVSLKVLIVSEAAAERELLRRAASQASVLIEVVEVERADSAAATCGLLASENVDAVFLDARMPRPEREAVTEAVRICKSRPVVVLVGPADIRRREVATDGLPVDGVLARPITPEEASAALSACVRARGLGRVLVVDDSATVRSVVRKVLQASRYRLESEEADGGEAALACAGKAQLRCRAARLRHAGDGRLGDARRASARSSGSSGGDDDGRDRQ